MLNLSKLPLRHGTHHICLHAIDQSKSLAKLKVSGEGKHTASQVAWEGVGV